MLKKISIGLAAAIGIFLVVVAMQPDTYQVTRKATIAAEPAKVFALVNDFHEWTKWSPWEKLDPNMARTFGGTASGTGATYAWKGNSDAGSGQMTVTESRPAERVGIKLEFVEPFASVADTVFAFTPNGGATEVQWTMSGDHNFISKAMCLFVSMDKMVGPDFEKGLAQMKTVAEAR